MNKFIRLLPVRASSGTASIARLFSGEVDVAYVGMTPFLIARALGVPVRLLALGQRLGTAHGVILRRDAQPNDGTVALSIGTALGSTGHQIGAEWAESIENEVTFVHMAPRDQLAAFMSGMLDGIACWEPYLTIADQAGGIRVFDAGDLTRPLFNTLAASDAAITRKGTAVEAFLKANAHAVSAITAEEIVQEDVSLLRELFEQTLTSRDYIRILQEGYGWPSGFFTGAPDESHEVWEAIEGGMAFLKGLRMVPSGADVRSNCFAESWGDDSAALTEGLRVAYSGSTMCAPFHLARAKGLFREFGLELPPDGLSLEERMAYLSQPYRDRVRRFASYVDERPDVTVIETRREVEEWAREILRELSMQRVPESLDEMLRILHAREAVPADIIGLAHGIRVRANPIVHRGGERYTTPPAKARAALNQLLEIFEWSQAHLSELLETKQFCANCGKLADRQYDRCAYCGESMLRVCEICGEEMEPEWEICPRPHPT